MNEIRVPQALIVFFLTVPLFRPYVKALWPIDGIAWMPLLALGITAGIFPAYGFRPECLPMLAAALFFCVANLLPLAIFALSRRDSFFSGRKPLFTASASVLLCAAALPMFAFSPRAFPGQDGWEEPEKSVAVSNGGGEYLLRVYGHSEAARREGAGPVIFIVPPETGSAASVHLLCSRLRDGGYTVVTYSRKGYDASFAKDDGSPYTVPPAKLLRYWNIFRKASFLASANAKGKALEAERRADIDFLLPRIPGLAGGEAGDAPPPLLLAGYGAGGSALAYLAGEGGFAARHGSVLAVAAIESRLWSSYQPEPPALSGAPAGSNLFRRAWEAAVAGMKNLAPGKVGRTGPLPGQESGPLAAVSGPAVSGPMVPGPTVRRIPVLYVVSGRALSEIQAGWRRGNRPYRAVFDAFRSGAGPAALAAMEGAGPLDYQDFPFTHPVFSFLQPGQKGVKKSGNPVGDTAGIIGNFAVLLLEQARQAEQDWLLERMEEYNSGEDIELPEKKPEVYIPPRAPVSGGLYTESRGFPGFRL